MSRACTVEPAPWPMPSPADRRPSCPGRLSWASVALLTRVAMSASGLASLVEIPQLGALNERRHKVR
jgi:hypothetical protein